MQFRDIETLEVECLILGGGPAGLSAAIELGKAGVGVLLVDDKASLGGKLVLQTHKFFGSIEACHAGTRGMDIGRKLEKELRAYENVRIWTNSNALAVFSDRKVGVLRDGHYFLVQPQVLLVATGAREKSLVFKGNTLPGVYGAGAFQTLVNRDLVRPTERLFVVGGGNVGLIAAYHALQAGIEVVGLCEALPDCGGYKVHKDKLVRMGVPIYTSPHGALAPTARRRWNRSPSPSWTPAGSPSRAPSAPSSATRCWWRWAWSPVNEFPIKAKEFGLPVYAAGDAEEIAEASAAMFTGKIRGLEIARALGRDVGEVPAGVAPHRGGAQVPPRRHHHRGDPRGRGGRVPGVPLLPGDPLQPLHQHLPPGLHPDRGQRHPGRAHLQRGGLHRLRAVRGRVPGPGGDPGGLPQAGRGGPGVHPLRIPRRLPSRWARR